MGKEQSSVYYDNIFENSDFYKKEWNEMGAYSHIWINSIILLKHTYKISSVLDIGCGMGQFGNVCQDHNIKYKGIDFSKYAISYAESNKSNLEEYLHVDALTYKYEDDVEAYTTHEFLEHIKDDLEIFTKLKSNKPVIFSLPDFDDPGHVRWFKTIEEIKHRYGKFFKELHVKAITSTHYLCHGILN